jgi:hypothetical protein
MYCSNLSFKFSRQTQKKLVGISHYGHHLLAYTETFSAKTETLSAKTENFSAKTE